MKKVKRFDLSEIGKFEMTPQGFMKIPGFATRTGVFTYKDGDGNIRRELRHPDEVFDPASLKTLQNSPVTLDHPPVMVEPTNIHQFIKGYCTDKVGVNRELVEAELIVSHKDAIDAIEGGLRELSSGYTADLKEESGIYNGARYDFRQTNIKYNHVALVDKGRAGPEVRLRLDSADAVMETNQGELKMKMDTIKIGDQEVEMPRQAAMVVKDMMDRYDELKAKSDMQGSEVESSMEDSEDKKMAMMDMYKDMKAMHSDMMGGEEKGDNDPDLGKGISPNIPDEDMAPEGTKATKKVTSADTDGPKKAAGYDSEDDDEHGDEENDGVAKAPAQALAEALSKSKDLKDKLDMANAKLDEYESKGKGGCSPKMDSAKFNQAVASRINLIKKAERLVDTKTSQKFDSMTDHQIRCASIRAVHPSVDLKGKSGVYVEARFDSITEQVSAATTLRVGTRNSQARMDKYSGANAEDARQRYMEQSKQAWKTDLSATKK